LGPAAGGGGGGGGGAISPGWTKKAFNTESLGVGSTSAARMGTMTAARAMTEWKTIENAKVAPLRFAVDSPLSPTAAVKRKAPVVATGFGGGASAMSSKLLPDDYTNKLRASGRLL
jgi:hypothetical protein